MPDLWSALDSPKRVERIMKVMERAGREKSFRDDCLGPNGRTTIETYADVTFDPNFVLQCYSNRKAVEDQIVLLFPSIAFPDPPAPKPPVKEFWLCTYVDYVPA
jgi:hypothetical protein